MQWLRRASQKVHSNPRFASTSADSAGRMMFLRPVPADMPLSHISKFLDAGPIERIVRLTRNKEMGDSQVLIVFMEQEAALRQYNQNNHSLRVFSDPTNPSSKVLHFRLNQPLPTHAMDIRALAAIGARGLSRTLIFPIDRNTKPEQALKQINVEGEIESWHMTVGPGARRCIQITFTDIWSAWKVRIQSAP
jgi:hypothetical protein